MAILTNTASGGHFTGWEVNVPAPTGVHLAVCLDIKETPDFETTDFNTGQPVKHDVIRFLYGLKVGDDKFLVQSNTINISGSPKSNLIKLITAWMGQAPQVQGFDTEILRGKPCQLTSEQVTSTKGTVYSKVTQIAGVIEQYKAAAPKPDEFKELLSIAGADFGEIAPPAPADPLIQAQPGFTTEPLQAPIVQQAIQPKPQSATGVEADVPF